MGSVGISEPAARAHPESSAAGAQVDVTARDMTGNRLSNLNSHEGGRPGGVLRSSKDQLQMWREGNHISGLELMEAQISAEFVDRWVRAEEVAGATSSNHDPGRTGTLGGTLSDYPRGSRVAGWVCASDGTGLRWPPGNRESEESRTSMGTELVCRPGSHEQNRDGISGGTRLDHPSGGRVARWTRASNGTGLSCLPGSCEPEEWSASMGTGLGCHPGSHEPNGAGTSGGTQSDYPGDSRVSGRLCASNDTGLSCPPGNCEPEESGGLTGNGLGYHPGSLEPIMTGTLGDTRSDYPGGRRVSGRLCASNGTGLSCPPAAANLKSQVPRRVLGWATVQVATNPTGPVPWKIPSRTALAVVEYLEDYVPRTARG